MCVQTIKQFKRGDFNVLVATSIGEEGLDIGEVDLIVCYETSKSPIRMVRCALSELADLSSSNASVGPVVRARARSSS